MHMLIRKLNFNMYIFLDFWRESGQNHLEDITFKRPLGGPKAHCADNLVEFCMGIHLTKDESRLARGI